MEVGEGVLGKEQGEERRGTALSVDCVTTFSSPLLREIRSRGISLARSLAEEVYLRAWCPVVVVEKREVYTVVTARE